MYSILVHISNAEPVKLDVEELPKVTDTCVIGDTPADIRCARAIGARAAAVATGGYSSAELSPHEPDHLFEDLSRTVHVAEKLLERAR